MEEPLVDGSGVAFIAKSEQRFQELSKFQHSADSSDLFLTFKVGDTDAGLAEDAMSRLFIRLEQGSARNMLAADLVCPSRKS